jgi:hypothetical protein
VVFPESGGSGMTLVFCSHFPLDFFGLSFVPAVLVVSFGDRTPLAGGVIQCFEEDFGASLSTLDGDIFLFGYALVVGLLLLWLICYPLAW